MNGRGPEFSVMPRLPYKYVLVPIYYDRSDDQIRNTNPNSRINVPFMDPDRSLSPVSPVLNP